MLYETQEEMDKVIGKLTDNSFINPTGRIESVP